MGGIVDRKPTPGETAEMQRLLADALEAGAWGMSTGLVYTPSAYADTAEILDLGEVLARYGAMYASHTRNDGARVLEAVEEAMRRMTSLPAEILALADRGHLAESQVADLALFDAHAVRDRSTYADPAAQPEGIEAVYLGGHQVVAGGEVVAHGMGSVLRRR